MSHGKVVLCSNQFCKFPVTRFGLPIIWPHKEGKCVPFCSVECLEIDMMGTLPEPLRSELLSGAKNGPTSE